MKADIVQTVKECRVCGFKPLTTILSLGNLYVSDFVSEDADMEKAGKAPLELVLCNEKDGGCGLLQLRHTVSHKAMYRNYWYRSGINKTMADELKNIVDRVKSLISLKNGDFVIDIGSNDSTFLRFYNTPGLNTVGFEPAKNLVEKYGLGGVTKIITDFFAFSLWQKEYGNVKAKVITAIAMFYDLDNPNTFVADMVKCLDEDGIIVIQMLHLPYLLKRNAFDGICHEHLEYYSLSSLEKLFKRHGLEVFDAEFRPINEGSLRYYIRRRGKGKLLRIRPGAQERVEKFRVEEQKMKLYDKHVYDEFVDRVMDIKTKLTEFIQGEVSKRKKIYVYGASTKGNTLLQFFGIDHKLIVAAAERNPDKWGKRTVGTLIPIVSEEEMRKAQPDYLLILPWHFIEEFKEREKWYLKKGGKFIVPLPEFKVIGLGDV